MTADRNAIRELVADLVSIETENPPGNEAECAERVRDWFERRGIPADLVDQPDPERPQVAAQIGTGDPTVVLNGHLDVVPAGDQSRWIHPPYGAVVDDGRLYGRGSADMKAGVALAMLTAAALKDDLNAGTLQGSVVVHGAMGEETAEPGTRYLLEEGYDGDYGVCLEATGMRTATSEKGLAWYELTVAGEPAHASRPDQGLNAIRRARPVLDALEAYDERIRERTDDLVGAAYATTTMVQAGTKENVVPEEATITIDRRFLPAEAIEDIDEEIASLCEEVEDEHAIEVAWERTRVYESAAIPPDSRVAEVFRTHSAEIANVSAEPYGTRASTDVRNLINDAGMEAITWGPGDLAQAHTYDEHIELATFETGARVLKRAVRELLRDG